MKNAFTDLASKMLDDYKKIPRDEKLSKEASEKVKEEIRKSMGGQSNVTEKSKEILAVQDMRELLDLIEKKVLGKLTDQDQELMRKKVKQWEKSINLLKKSLLN